MPCLYYIDFIEIKKHAIIELNSPGLGGKFAEESIDKLGIIHITPKVVNTFLRRLPINGAWLQKVSTGK